ncbi:MAG TPA: class I SAM-dependent methyltransferase [Stellaceae bacterium]|nr:class I SAM-dependent methyltransferase [Stellaceae bacterium]
MDGPSNSRARLAMEHWGTRDDFKCARDYYTFPPLVPYHIEAITGRAQPYSLTWFEDFLCDTYLPPSVDRLISLCCGFGDVERYLANRGLFRECLAYDIAPGAIAGARRHAAEAGITTIRYEQADLNRTELAPESAEVVWANGALHHIERLEHVVGQIYRALRSSGVLVAGEYVGPDHNRPTPRQHELINAMIHMLPPRLRSSARLPGSTKSGRARFLTAAAVMQFNRGRAGDPPPPAAGRMGTVRQAIHTAGSASARLWPRDPFRFDELWRYDRRYFRKVDPSEGVRASDVIPVIRATFSDVEVRYHHGTLLIHALDGAFYDNFDADSAADQAVLRSLVQFERDAIERGEIVSENAVIIARKP